MTQPQAVPNLVTYAGASGAPPPMQYTYLPHHGTPMAQPTQAPAAKVVAPPPAVTNGQIVQINGRPYHMQMGPDGTQILVPVMATPSTMPPPQAPQQQVVAPPPAAAIAPSPAPSDTGAMAPPANEAVQATNGGPSAPTASHPTTAS